MHLLCCCLVYQECALFYFLVSFLETRDLVEQVYIGTLPYRYHLALWDRELKHKVHSHELEVCCLEQGFVVYITVVLIPIPVSETLPVPYKMQVSKLACIDPFCCVESTGIQSPATLEQTILLRHSKNENQKMPCANISNYCFRTATEN